jgi:molecular chaperone DnaJ
MSAVRDPWVLLGVSRSADDAEIKKAYRRLARELHPDRNRGDDTAPARFQDVARAYESIRDEAARALWLTDNEGVRSAEGDFPPFPQSAAPKPTETVEEVGIDFRQAFSGARIEIPVQVEDVCTLCGGTGAAPGYAPRRCEICAGRGEIAVGSVTQPCSSCEGRGYLIDRPCGGCRNGLLLSERMILVQIPAGIADGHELSVPTVDPARPGGNGQLRVRVRVSPSPIFKREFRDPADLLLEVPITFSEAMLGATVRIPTPAKIVEIRVPPGTPANKTFKITGEGMPRVGLASRGDLYARLAVVVPDDPSKKQKALAEALAAEDDPAQLRYRLFNPGSTS